MMTSSGWCDTSIQYKVFQVLLAVLKGSVTLRNMQDMIKKPVCILAKLLSGYICNYELLSGVARCASYEPYITESKIKWRE